MDTKRSFITGRRKRSFIFLLTTLLISGIIAFAPGNDDPLEKLVAALEKWTAANPQEKIYLHTDKPYYLVGDTIWFKAYVAVGAKHQLSTLSGAVYVDLISESDSTAQSLKLPLTAGMASGAFVLADSTMSDGSYRIRAYTQWMRNAGSDYFYDRVFRVGNSIANPVYSTIKYEYAKNGANTVVTAVVTYTDDKGEPYAGKEVSYDVLDNSSMIVNGKKQTDAKGEVRIELKPGKQGKFTNSRLATRLRLDKESVVTKNFMVKSVAMESDLQFFPESGPLVNGARSRIAFKATGTGGNGIDVKGVIVDNDNNQVAEFESSHLGMGVFQMTPETGKQYTAKVTYADGSQNTVKLPAASDDGFNMAVFNNSETDTVLIRIRPGAAASKSGNESVGLIAQSGGTVFFANNIAVNKPTVTIPVPAKELPTGIVQFTLISSAGAAINERIVFIQHGEEMKLNLTPSKQSYGVREKVAIDLTASDAEGKPLTGSFSVSVINETAVPVEEGRENSIFAQLLLTSDIKGYIEEPNYYFTNVSEETRSNLDILMMTQGYRRFLWKDLASGKPSVQSFKAEKLTSEITGKVLTLGNKPLQGAKVIVMSNKMGGIVGDTVTDAQGNFKLDRLLIAKGVEFTVQARSDKGSNKVELKLNMPSAQLPTPNPNIGDIELDSRKTMASVLENSRKQESDLLKRGMLGRTQQLREVQIKARKRSTNSNGIYSIPDGHADNTIKPDPTDQFKDVLEFMTMRLPNVTFRMEDTGECGQLMVPYSRNERLTIILNGRKLTPCENLPLYEANPSDIVKIDVVRSNMALMNMIGGSALIVTTKHGAYRLSNDFSVKQYSQQGYDVSKEFYSPKYNNDGNDSQLADLRTTVYWNPMIVSKDGKASFDFFNADSKGTYRVLVEGMTPDGKLGRKIVRYKVE
ncbi:TonB-dependent receptor [Pedobacter sp. JY14-1]|uniref:TonB-dependent receptor n=1 Tax=Pedobacter sp. JY14-1 TaxID=3034151 RepID=UPI0023E1C98C|nr:TonB-dependent receptor [Pedobacter sp. JY14-1]